MEELVKQLEILKEWGKELVIKYEGKVIAIEKGIWNEGKTFSKRLEEIKKSFDHLSLKLFEKKRN